MATGWPSRATGIASLVVGTGAGSAITLKLLLHDNALAVGIGGLASLVALVVSWLIEHELTRRAAIPSKVEDVVATYRARATYHAVKAATSRTVLSRKAAVERRRDGLAVLKELGTADAELAATLGATRREDDGADRLGDQSELTIVNTDGSSRAL